MSKLTSDKPQLDGHLKQQAIESAKYPDATFALTSPISIAELPDHGKTVPQTIAAKLTLHGVTRDVTMQVRGALDGDQLSVAGGTNIALAGCGIQSPKSMVVVL